MNSVYRNVSTLKLDPKCQAILSKPIQKQELTINHKGWLYLHKDGYHSRLTEAFGNSYKLEPTSNIKQLKNIKFQSFAMYVDDVFVSEAYGESLSPDEGEMKDELEYTALVRTCKDLLVASELWDPSVVKKMRSLYFVQKWDSLAGKYVWKSK